MGRSKVPAGEHVLEEEDGRRATASREPEEKEERGRGTREGVGGKERGP